MASDPRDILELLQRARSHEELEQLLAGFAEQFGAEYLVIGTQPPPGTLTPKQHQRLLALGRWPTEWVERYFERGYFIHDPAAERIRDSSLPFAWQELEGRYKEAPITRRVMNEAADFKLRRGLTVPFELPFGMRGFVSYAGPHFEFGPVDRLALAHVAHRAMREFVVLLDQKLGAVRLTPRERQVLRTAADGRTYSAVGRALGISENAVTSHMKRIQRKMNVHSREAAVLRAVGLGLCDLP